MDIKFIVDLFKELMKRFPLQLKRSDIDRNSPYFCDDCNRMSMTLVHSGILKPFMRTAFGTNYIYHGLYHCKCGKLKGIQVDEQNIAASCAKQNLVKELKLKKVIVEKPDGFVTYHPDRFYQDPE